MRNIFITGINSGIGKALTETLLKEDVKIYAVGKSPKAKIVDNRVKYAQLDLSATEKIESVLMKVLKGVKSLDLCILNAGVLGEIKELKDTNLREIESVMSINVWANKVIIDTLIDLNIEIEQIVGISSGAAVNGNKGWGAYSLSKAALNMLLKLYSNEMPNTHITALAPGVVDTPMVRHIVEDVDSAKFPSAARLKSGPIMEPSSAALRLLEAFKKAKEYESGSFLDVRSMA
ncbi:MAG: SDR family NAD(P)-dependent oxidoreductase [Hydrogenimonas sp.]|nr:SDR family NAD(P)-dependent oxidoreductase [Hydrogenimonas sp.]